jgi:hypothetical protein
MTDHAHEFPPQGVLPPAICPSIEVLVHRRATELIAERPRRRIAMASSVGGVAVAAVAAVLVLVLGSPSGGGLLSPRQAVAAVVQTLEGNGILHWVREGDLVESPDQADHPGTIVEDEWIDLSNGNLHRIDTRTPRGEEPRTRLVWRTSAADWFALPSDASAGLTIKRDTASAASETVVDRVRTLLQRAEQGAAEIADGGEDRGRALVVVTERRGQDVQRLWITREGDPEVVRTETSVVSRNAPRPIVTTSRTTTWQIAPRTPEALADVEIPSNAKRVP